MLRRKNRPVRVYELHESIRAESRKPSSNAALLITRGEIIEHMKGLDYVFSKRDIKKGTIVLPPLVVASLVSRPGRSILETTELKAINLPPHKKPSRHSARHANSISVTEILPSTPAPAEEASSTKTNTFSFRASISNRLAARKLAKERAANDEALKDEADITAFYDSFPEKTRHSHADYRYRKLGVFVSGLSIAFVAAGPANAGIQSGLNAIDSANKANMATDLYAPYKEIGNALENSFLNIQNK